MFSACFPCNAETAAGSSPLLPPQSAASFSQYRHRDVNELHFKAHRLLSSTAGARSGAARASRSRAARAARASAAGRFKQMAWSSYLAAGVLYRLKSCVLVHIQRCVDLVWLLQPRAHQCAGASLILASIIVRISWLTGRGQQSDSYRMWVKSARAFSFAHSLASTWALLES